MSTRPLDRCPCRGLLLLVPLGALALPGCGTDGFARDTLIENRGAEAFLDRIQQNCAKLSVGNQQIDWMLSQDSNDTVFVDTTSKYYFGQISAAKYRSNIEAFYPTGTNGPALDCIDAQLKKGTSPQP
jgi:hypothetical protein